MENCKNYFGELCQYVRVCKRQQRKHSSDREDNGDIYSSQELFLGKISRATKGHKCTVILKSYGKCIDVNSDRDV